MDKDLAISQIKQLVQASGLTLDDIQIQVFPESLDQKVEAKETKPALGSGTQTNTPPNTKNILNPAKKQAKQPIKPN